MVAADAGLLLLLTALLWLVLGTAQAAVPPVPGLPTGLSVPGTGPSTPAAIDPVRALAIDIAEHLPGNASGAATPPLPLHAPVALFDGLTHDELQGLEWASLQPAGGATMPASQRAPLPACDRFASTDPRRDERPPTAPDRLQP